ncbi:oligosaccharyltransferase complex subunit epsilon [Lambiella insularis]|nr:oligosaccharyltransferase complex subunit epsilon [Lambiella insularis]
MAWDAATVHVDLQDRRNGVQFSVADCQNLNNILTEEGLDFQDTTSFRRHGVQFSVADHQSLNNTLPEEDLDFGDITSSRRRGVQFSVADRQRLNNILAEEDLSMAPRNRAAAPSSSSSSTSPPTRSQPAAAPAPTSSKLSLLDTIKMTWGIYLETTPSRLKAADTFMVHLMITALPQFVYCLLFGTYPFNAFLSGFGICVGQFVLTANLRMQCNPENAADFTAVTEERYVVSNS